MPNLDATKPKDVYRLEDLAPPKTLGQIDVADWVEAANSGEGVETVSRFVANRLHALAENEEIRKLQILRYMLAMLQFFLSTESAKMGSRRLPKREELQKKVDTVGRPVFEGIKRNFAAGG